MIAGPRTFDRSTRAPFSTTTRPSIFESTASPSSRGSISSSTSRLASSMSSRWPVSFHHPVTTWDWTGAVIDQGLDRLGDLQLAAPEGSSLRAAARIAGWNM